MDTEIITKELTKFNTTDAAIAVIRQQYMELTVEKAGVETIHAARMDVKTRRVAVTKKGKELREDAIKFSKSVIEEEKRIIGLLQPIEDHLGDEESRFEEEKARIKAEAEAKIAAALQARVNKLFAMGCRFDGASYIYGNLVAPHVMIKVAPEEQFEKICSVIQDAIDEEAAARAAEAERIAKVAAEQEKERIRLTEEALRIKKEQDRVAAEQAKERERLVAEATAIHFEKERLAREKKDAEDKEAARVKWVEEQKQKVEMERLRQEELMVTAREAAEKARIETEERIKREAAEIEAKWKADAEEKARKEEAARVRAEKKAARLPDKDKLTAFCNNYFARATPDQNIGYLKTDEGRLSFEAIWIIIQTAEHDCREIVEKL